MFRVHVSLIFRMHFTNPSSLFLGKREDHNSERHAFWTSVAASGTHWFIIDFSLYLRCLAVEKRLQNLAFNLCATFRRVWYCPTVHQELSLRSCDPGAHYGNCISCPQFCEGTPQNSVACRAHTKGCVDVSTSIGRGMLQLKLIKKIYTNLIWLHGPLHGVPYKNFACNNSLSSFTASVPRNM